MKKFFFILLSVTYFDGMQAQLDVQSKSHALKYDFFSPVAGCFGFSLETTKSDFISLDIDAGFIGLQLGDYFLYDKFVGGYASAGPRFYFKKDEGMEGTNNFKGGYFKPELLVNYFSFEYEAFYFTYISGESISENISGTDFSASLLLCLGNQWVLSDIITFDIWFGLGYGGNWINEEREFPENDEFYISDQNSGFKFSYVRFGDSPLIFDGGLSVGILLK